VDQEIEDLILRMARENRSWGYNRIQGALNNLGYTISDQTVGNILKRQGISPAPERKHTVTWREFVRCHWDMLLATDFFTSDVWSWFGRMVSSLLSFIHLGPHQVSAVGMTQYHHVRWIGSLLLPSRGVNALVQIGRRVVQASVRLQLLLLDAWCFSVPLSACTTEAHRAPVPQACGRWCVCLLCVPVRYGTDLCDHRMAGS
jgi:hypothetical protein